DAESATFLDGRGDERDHPFILGATSVDLPTYKVGYLALLRRLREQGVDGVYGHLLFAVSDAEYAEAEAWLARVGVLRALEPDVVPRGAGESAIDGHHDHLGLRDLEDARGLLPGPGRPRLRDRQVARGRSLCGPAVDGDEDGGPGRRPALRGGDPRAVPGQDA